ncbi:hypothetical protein [Desulfovibrio falkowii]|uniref:hypothetical protein n=1 Tax=Desulfovibrio sp. WGS1351 TaxID=3366814 RepID=UPI00372D026D
MQSLKPGKIDKIGIVLLLFVMILALPGCQSSAALTSANLPPAPPTPGAVVTNSWAYEHDGQLVTKDGQWVHLPASEAGELLLWIEHAEATCP